MENLSFTAKHVLDTCARILDTTVDDLAADFGASLQKLATDNYSKRLVEFCGREALPIITTNLSEKIRDGSFSRFSFDLMLAWKRPNIADEPKRESFAKEREDKEPVEVNEVNMDDDTSLFYSDIMPLLVDDEPGVEENEYVWLGSLIPLPSDPANAQFTFEALTSTTAYKLYYPAYDKFLKEMDKCQQHLQELSAMKNIEFDEDEFVLHQEGASGTPRVVRHIGPSSWPGRLTLTNKALYFEASATMVYEPALKVELSLVDVDHQVRAASTGPWGAPLFDKAISYESSQMPDPLVIEFPEITGSTRRDLWLALVKEVILLHRFIHTYNIESNAQVWEMHSRMILGVTRLHSAKQMLRMSPPIPNNFLVFTLYDELPKGDIVLEELANSLKETSSITALSASYVLETLGVFSPLSLIVKPKETPKDEPSSRVESISSLQETITQVKDEAEDVGIVKSSIEGIKEDTIGDSVIVLAGLLRPLSKVLVQINGILHWERPFITASVLISTLIIEYNEWVGYALATMLVAGAGLMLRARQKRIGEKCMEVIVEDASYERTTVENIVEAYHNLNKAHEWVKSANIAMLKLWSILLARSPKHTNKCILVLLGAAMLLLAIPFRYLLIGLTLYGFLNKVVKPSAPNTNPSRGSRRLREWWQSVPVIPVRIVGSSVMA